MNPKVRIGKYSDDWSSCSASGVFNQYSDKGHPELPVLSASQEYGMVRRDSIGINMNYSTQNISSYKHILPGQFVIHLRSFQGGFAHSAIEGISSPAYTILKFKEDGKHDDYFWKYYFSSIPFIKRLETVTYGIRDGRSISVEDFMELSLSMPTSKDEESMIGKFFHFLNEHIYSADKELTKLKNLKKACLEKMFPKKGSLVPEIRFDKFKGDWNRPPLCKLAHPYYVSNQLIHHQNLLSLSYGRIIRKDIKMKKGLLPASFDTYQVIKPGIIVLRFTDLQNDHNSLRVGLSEEEGIITSAYVCIECSEEVYPEYMYLLLHHYDLQKIYYSMGEGLRQTMNYNDIKDLNVLLPPTPEEQIAIAEYYTNLEDHINAREKKLTKLKNIKKSLLEKMYVSND